MPGVDWQAWLEARRAELQACRDAAAIDTFRQGMQMAYEASERGGEGWRIPDAQRHHVARLVVERLREMERGR